MTVHWSHAALNCAQLPATEGFYTRWFGFRRANEFDLGELRIVFLRLGDAYLELFSNTDGGPAPASSAGDGPGGRGQVRHLAFQTDDLDAFLARMDGQADISLGPLDFSEHIPGWRSVWLRDPDGVIVEVSEGYRDRPAPVEAAP